MDEEVLLITKEDLINSGFDIIKKLVMIDSTIYTPEAFEYILSLVDSRGAICFVSDSKKIYAQGRYFGGDIFQADLLYFTDFAAVANNGIIKSKTSAKHPKSTLYLQGLGHVVTNAIYDDETGANTVTFDYNLSNAVNKDSFTIDTNAEYKLDVVNGQVKMIKYVPCKVILSSLDVLEYDSGDTIIEIDMKYIGSEDLVSLNVTTEEFDVGIIDLEQSTNEKIVATIPNNTDVTFVVEYSDGKTVNYSTIKQIWGYGIWYGSLLEWNQEQLINLNKYVAFDNPNGTLTIEQNGNEYGFFICPSEWEIKFIDNSTNLQGGWRPFDTFTYYGFNTEYTVYKTEQSGLGYVKWTISKI